MNVRSILSKSHTDPSYNRQLKELWMILSMDIINNFLVKMALL